MRNFLLVTAFTVLLPLPILAQDFSDRYSVNGQYDLIVDGTALTSFTTIDAENGRSSVDRHEVMGKVFYNVNGSIPKDDGTRKTVVSVQLWPDHVSDIQFTADGLFGADIPGGSMSLDAPPIIGDDGSIAFAFHGTLIEFSIADGEFTPVEGGRKIMISGSYSGKFPVE